jgi:hypothetical protein
MGQRYVKKQSPTESEGQSHHRLAITDTSLRNDNHGMPSHHHHGPWAIANIAHIHQRQRAPIDRW